MIQTRYTKGVLPAIVLGVDGDSRTVTSQSGDRGLWIVNHQYGGNACSHMDLAGWILPTRDCPDAVIGRGLDRLAETYYGANIQPTIPVLVSLQQALHRISPALEMKRAFWDVPAEAYVPLDLQPLWPLIAEWPCVRTVDPVSTMPPPFATQQQAAEIMVESGLYWETRGKHFHDLCSDPVRNAEKLADELSRHVSPEPWTNRGFSPATAEALRRRMLSPRHFLEDSFAQLPHLKAVFLSDNSD